MDDPDRTVSTRLPDSSRSRQAMNVFRRRGPVEPERDGAIGNRELQLDILRLCELNDQYVCYRSTLLKGGGE